MNESFKVWKSIYKNQMYPDTPCRIQHKRGVMPTEICSVGLKKNNAFALASRFYTVLFDE